MSGEVTLGELGVILILVVVAIALSRYRSADLERDLMLAVVRSFVQLSALGYVIQAIFDSESIWLVCLLLAAMVAFGTFTAGRRAGRVPGQYPIILLALSLAAAVTLGLIVVLGVFPPTPRYLIPVGGIVIGNSMTAIAVSLDRLGDEVHRGVGELEATLALGATWRQASTGLVARSLRSAMIPLVDQTKTVGLVTLPGAMVGMLVAGAEPLEAVRLQLVLLWSLLGSVAMAAVIATSLGSRGFFTPAHQLRDLDERPAE